MTKINVKKLIEYWREGSDRDAASAANIAFKARQCVQACFFVHLSVEKALKALIVELTREHAPYSHSLPLLAKKADVVFSVEQLTLLEKINGYNLTCRYPDDQYKIYKTLNAATTKK